MAIAREHGSSSLRKLRKAPQGAGSKVAQPESTIVRKVATRSKQDRSISRGVACPCEFSGGTARAYSTSAGRSGKGQGKSPKTALFPMGFASPTGFKVQ